MAEIAAKIQGVIDASINPKSLDQYDSCWRHFQGFCADKAIPPLEVDPTVCLEYLYTISENAGVSRVYTYLSAISHNYRRSGKTSPCDDVRIRMFMKGLKRTATPVRRARPLTVDILEKCVSRLETDDSLVTWRTVWRMVVTFSCFLRWDDIKRLKVEHLHEASNDNGRYFRIELVGGKTNQTNEEDHRVIASTSSLVCPYTLTKRYLERLGPAFAGSLQPTCHPRDPQRPAARAISYPNAVKNLRELLDSLGYEGKSYSEHSSKRGAATRSAEIGLGDDEIQVAGHWKDSRTVRAYIERNPRQHQRLVARVFEE